MQTLSRKAVIQKTSLSQSTIDRLEKAGDFPKHFLITPRRAGWYAEEVDTWLRARRSENIETDSKLPCVTKKVSA
jgi:prophage regulatory protein